MSSKKAGGSTVVKNQNPKYRGVKKFGGEKVKSGNIIVRQVGNKFHAGQNVGCGKDFTLFATTSGSVKFRIKRPQMSRRSRTYVDVLKSSFKTDDQ